MPRTKAPITPVRCTRPEELALTPCGRCNDRAIGPEDGSGYPCAVCDGGRFQPQAGNLGSTRSNPKGRPFLWNPGSHALWLERVGKPWERYTVTEFPADPIGGTPVRAFRFVKESTGECYDLQCFRGSLSCECRGFVSEGTRRANERAQATGGVVMEGSLGCSHSDFIRLALAAGLMEVR